MSDMFTEKYKKWVEQANLEPLTNTQQKFAEWLLLEENSKQISQIGNLDIIFKSIRQFLKK